MRRQQRARSRRDVGNKDIRIRSLGLLLRIDDVLAVFRPDGIGVAFILRRVGGEVLYLAHQRVVDIDLVGRRSFRFHLIRQVPAIGRPCRIHLRDLASAGEVDDLSGLGRDQKNIPLLVAVVIGLVRDPFAIGRPCGRGLALVADGELHRPSAFGGNEPEVIASAHIRDEGDALAVGRPRGPADLARHVQLLDGQAARFDLRVGLGGDLLGIGDGLGRGQSLGSQVSETTVLMSMTIAKSANGRMDAVASRIEEKFSRT